LASVFNWRFAVGKFWSLFQKNIAFLKFAIQDTGYVVNKSMTVRCFFYTSLLQAFKVFSRKALLKIRNSRFGLCSQQKQDRWCRLFEVWSFFKKSITFFKIRNSRCRLCNPTNIYFATSFAVLFGSAVPLTKAWSLNPTIFISAILGGMGLYDFSLVWFLVSLRSAWVLSGLCMSCVVE